MAIKEKNFGAEIFLTKTAISFSRIVISNIIYHIESDNLGQI